MSRDLLEEATRALRETVDGSCEDARAAEADFAALLPRARRVRRVRPWIFSLAAVFVGSSVWATTRGPLAPWFERVVASDSEEESSDVAPRSVSRASSASPEAARTPTSDLVDAPPNEPPRAGSLASGAPPSTDEGLASDEGRPSSRGVTAVSSSSVGARSRPEEPVASPSALSPAPAPTSSQTLDVYEQAHELHFVRRDYARALVAWERYLEVAPRGALALEARFHRAVCLARTGAKDAARSALAPFARGDYGTYRREQAQQLLDELAVGARP